MLVSIGILLLVLCEFIFQFILNYPPTIQQLDIGIHSQIGLWAVRLGSLALILATTYIFSRYIPEKLRKFFWIILFASPTISLLWMSYPYDAFKLFLISTPFLFLKRGRRLSIFFIASAVIVLLVNLTLFKENPTILKAASIQTAQEEINHRFLVENGINPHIEVFYPIRKMAYNKYFVMMKNTANESLTFFNFESLFFKEVTPIDQKGTVLFFWPEILLFAVGIWVCLRRYSDTTKQVVILFVLSFLYFLTTNSSIDRRFALTVIPTAFVIACGIDYAKKSSSLGLKSLVCVIIFITCYGWATNIFDRYTRHDYWFDNRPYAYQFLFNELAKIDYKNYKQIEVPDTLYAFEKYCTFYLTTCPPTVHKNYDLTKENIKSDILYIGFLGNFISPNIESKFPEDYTSLLQKSGLEIIAQKHIHDNIANTYGQELLIVKESGKQ